MSELILKSSNHFSAMENLLSNLTELILDETSVSTPETAILCGHYALNWKGGVFSDYIDSANVNDENSQFSLLTFELGCRLARKIDKAKIIVLVNDWQHFSNNNRSTYLKKVDRAIIKDYYQNMSKLPDPLIEVMNSHNIDKSRILKKDEDSWLFSELELREEFTESIKSLLDTNSHLTSFVKSGRRYTAFKSSNSDIYDYTNGDNPISLVCENSANCAGEIIQLLYELRDLGIKQLINIYPRACFNFVNVGSILATEIYEIENMRIINIAVPFSSGLTLQDVKITKVEPTELV